MDRRGFIKGAAASMALGGNMAGQQIDLSPQEYLLQNKRQLSRLWDLFSAGTPVKRLEPDILLISQTLRGIARQPGALQRQAQLQLAEVLQFRSLLELHQRNYGRCLESLEESQKLAERWNDADRACAAVVRKCFIDYYAGQPMMNLLHYQQAMAMINKVQSPLIKSRVFLGIACSYADLGQEKPVFYEKSVEFQPTVQEADPAYQYTHFEIGPINRARYHLGAGNYKQALQELGTENTIIAGMSSYETEAQSVLAQVWIAKDPDLGISATLALAEKAKITGSKLRLQEASCMYHQLVESGKKDRRLTELRNMLVWE
jgi:tetratricopeptide (TPR) repeat protein